MPDENEPATGIPGINMAMALSLYEGDMEILMDIMESYAKHVPTELERMRCVSEETLRNYAIDIHTLKGASAGIGAIDLSQRAKRLEDLAKGGDLAGVLEHNEAFIKDAEALIEGIKAWVAATPQV